ncbi:MAG: DUF192 domain-containing protein [Gemmatimonadota bacterium]|nr:DUF192 domain-containing protein [Gemmatimonadota bacterium]
MLVIGLLAFILGCPAPDDGAVNDGARVATDEPEATTGTDAAPDTPAAGGRPPAGRAWVIFGADTVVAEIAATEEERSEGLMYREEVPDGTGMLFVFQNNDVRAFWMANTYVPLDIAYMDPSYRIVDIVQMEPMVTETYPSNAPAMFALEVRQGWFEERGIGEGDQAEIVFGSGVGR